MNLPITSILMGDWNSTRVLHDRSPPRFSNEDSPALLNNFLHNINCIVIFRETFPAKNEFTFLRATPNGVMLSRIDMIFVPRELAGQVQSVEVIAGLGCDHANSPRIRVSLPKATIPARANWRMNTAHLCIPYVKNRILDLLERIRMTPGSAYDRWLEF